MKEIKAYVSTFKIKQVIRALEAICQRLESGAEVKGLCNYVSFPFLFQIHISPREITVCNNNEIPIKNPPKITT